VAHPRIFCRLVDLFAAVPALSLPNVDVFRIGIRTRISPMLMYLYSPHTHIAVHQITLPMDGKLRLDEGLVVKAIFEDKSVLNHIGSAKNALPSASAYQRQWPQDGRGRVDLSR
jgi:hypothetical protein